MMSSLYPRIGELALKTGSLNPRKVPEDAFTPAPKASAIGVVFGQIDGPGS